MYVSCAFSIIFILFNCTGERAMVENADDGLLRCKLEASRTYEAGSPVVLRFGIENLTADTLHVLSWYTPLEGMMGNIFSVMRDSTEIRYRGRLVKRGEPQVSDYVRVLPRDTVHCTIDLTEGYDLSHPGRYTVVFSRELGDVARQGEKLPRVRDSHRPGRLPGNTVTFEVKAR